MRNLPVFSNFLNLASLSDSETVNFSTIARDCGVSSQTIKEYFQILEDTLLGRWLPSFRKRPKRRVAQSPKFYFSDVGIVNILAKRGTVQPGSELFGKAFENWCFHELNAYNIYSEAYAELSFWRLASGMEVDFVVNDMEIAIEAKSSEKISDNHLKGLRSLRVDHPAVKRSIVVCNDQKMRVTEDGIEVVPAHLFATMLWEGEWF